MVPPWINKFYILDLRDKNSYIKWCVDQGHTVFVISWVNPDAKLAKKSFDDYMTEGALTAIDAVCQQTGEKEVNIIGYCLGGTLLGSTIAYLKTLKDKRIASATYFVTMLDFSIPGELGVFIDEQQVSILEKKMAERGYLEGSEMAGTFNMLRANDLIWSFVVNNYLMGKEPFPFDLLFWNSDSTRMPYKMHSFYLRNMYMNNLLREPGGITLAGVPIDINTIKTPSYFISTIEDHIAPWKSVYLGAKRMAGPTRFVLGGSGHIAGIVNPPAANKYGYWTNDNKPPRASARRMVRGRQAASGLLVERLADVDHSNSMEQPRSRHATRPRASSSQSKTPPVPSSSFASTRRKRRSDRRPGGSSPMGSSPGTNRARSRWTPGPFFVAAAAPEHRSAQRMQSCPRWEHQAGPGLHRNRIPFAPHRRVVLDTNVLVALYVFADSRFAQLRARIESGEWQALTNDALLQRVSPRAGLPDVRPGRRGAETRAACL